MIKCPSPQAVLRENFKKIGKVFAKTTPQELIHRETIERKYIFKGKLKKICNWLDVDKILVIKLIVINKDQDYAEMFFIGKIVKIKAGGNFMSFIMSEECYNVSYPDTQ